MYEDAAQQCICVLLSFGEVHGSVSMLMSFMCLPSDTTAAGMEQC